MSVSIDGEQKLSELVDKLGISEEIKRKAIDAAADVYGNRLIANTPMSPDSKKNHLRDDVTFKKDQYPDGSVDVGFNKYGWYYRFVNNGTKYIHGKHFMEHSYDQAKDEMQKVMEDTLRNGDQ
ncbi:HK97 gp10 family phage protein [Sporolactobacillus sp. CQH2019]|uniref:HK97-gp10 family putative phage morphogenesis protein n=1 Tax=Sporolactobacillus sp. CQH2019 TaxID=3023512 RepID=UPI0023678C5D|nr:HK97-gp10 family putative phage morphogenesis protein [Sporolactobacillus sp. CQH2019]MDD9149334.1 HK97 gp10 family phage protein [Sporolactobacillus sp. CQH2019]